MEKSSVYHISSEDNATIRWSAKKVGSEHYGDLKIETANFNIEEGMIMNGEIILT